MNPDDDHTDQLHAARTRLHALTAIVAALERREDVSAVIADSDDGATAGTGLADLLDTDEAGAQAVLLLHWSAFTRARRQYAREDLERTREWVRSLEQGAGPQSR